MSAIRSQGFSIGIIALLILGIGFGGYLMSIQIDQGEKNGIQINKTLTKLDRAYEQIIQFQLTSNVSGQNTVTKILNSEENILGNLTDHRIVANATRDDVKGLIINALLTEGNIIGNLTDHRHVSNQTRDTDQAMLKEILNILRNQTR